MPEFENTSDILNYLEDESHNFKCLSVSRNEANMYVLLNGNIGWIMYTEIPDDEGLCTKSNNYSNENDEEVEYELDNGQIDEYPRRWAVSKETVGKVLVEFLNSGDKDKHVHWIEDDRY